VDVWLSPNRRAVGFAFAVPALLGSFGLYLALSRIGAGAGGTWQTALGLVLLVAAVVIMVGLVAQIRQPRVGYDDGHVIFNLRGGQPLRVPVECVEGFLLGQGPITPGESSGHHKLTRTVTVRLAESATEWSQVDVNVRLASWDDGYVTIRGTWCEPLDVNVVNRLNRLLSNAKKELTSANESEAADENDAPQENYADHESRHE